MSRPWMPLWVADYRSKTQRLTTLQHGAYLLLIMEYWEHGSLPDCDEQLAQITAMPLKDWRKIKTVLKGFFYDDWKHRKVEEELAKAAEISLKRSEAAKQKTDKPEAKVSAFADQEQVQNPSYTHNSQLTLVNSNKKGEVLGASQRQPYHGAKTKKGGGLVYFRPKTFEFETYLDGYLKSHGCDPQFDQWGGYWFKINGEPLAPTMNGLHPNYENIKQEKVK